jgi:S-DNA-T family DNA segregation ATPase FtsK/SpoIIIE
MASGGRTTRIHCPFVSDLEVEKVTENLKAQGEPHYIATILEEDEEQSSGDDDDFGSPEDDPMYNEAVTLILREGKASTSFLQRHLKIGYNRAARIIDKMEAAGIVSPANHVGKREVLGR